MIATSSPNSGAQELDGVDHAAAVRMVEQVVGDPDVVRALVDRLLHLDRRPVVLLLPLDLAAERRGLLDDREDGHDRVEAEDRVPGRGQARHQLGLAVGVGERRVDEVHELDGGHRGGVDQRRPVDGLAAQRGQHALAARHRRHLRGLAHSCAPGAVSRPRPTMASSSRMAWRTLTARGSSSPTSAWWSAPHGEARRRLVAGVRQLRELAQPAGGDPGAARRVVADVPRREAVGAAAGRLGHDGLARLLVDELQRPRRDGRGLVDLHGLQEQPARDRGVPGAAGERDRRGIVAGRGEVAEGAHGGRDEAHPLLGAGRGAVGVHDPDRPVRRVLPVQGDGQVIALPVHRDELDTGPRTLAEGDGRHRQLLTKYPERALRRQGPSRVEPREQAVLGVAVVPVDGPRGALDVARQQRGVQLPVDRRRHVGAQAGVGRARRLQEQQRLRQHLLVGRAHAAVAGQRHERPVEGQVVPGRGEPVAGRPSPAPWRRGARRGPRAGRPQRARR